MITLKRPDEIRQMRQTGELVVQAHRLVRNLLRPGTMTADIDGIIYEFFRQHEAVPVFHEVRHHTPFPAACCVSIDEQVVHAIPSERCLQKGQLVTIDTGCRWNGWCSDAAWTYSVGEMAPHHRKRELLNAGQTAIGILFEGLSQATTWSSVVRRMQSYVSRSGFTLVSAVMGHGIGRELHEDPQVPTAGATEMIGMSEMSGCGRCRNRDFRLEPGLVLTLEPVLTTGTGHTKTLSDGWTVVTCDGAPAVHFEITVAITEDGAVVLTDGLCENTD